MDASIYRLIPQAIAFAASDQEVAALLALSHDLVLPLTFRAAGTSLSGQAITDGILVDLSRAFGEIGVEEGGLRVRVRPGAIGGHVNLALQPYARKMGPDPASIHTCRMGGILSNNASGMCCGVEQNAYHTLQSLTFILPSGTRIELTDKAVDRVERLIREVVPHDELKMLVSNIGTSPGFSSIYTSNAGPHTATVQVAFGALLALGLWLAGTTAA